MNTDAINDIRKAAEALQAARYEFSRAETRSQAAATAYAKELNARYELRQIIDRYFSVPSTVLELCRLAEIGHCFVHDRPSDSKMEKMLRLEREYKEAKR